MRRPLLYAPVCGQLANFRHGAGSMQFSAFIAQGYSEAGDGPDLGIAGTASLRDVKNPRSGRRNCLDPVGVTLSILTFAPTTQMRCSTTALWRVCATIARTDPRRLATREALVRSELLRPRCSMTVSCPECSPETQGSIPFFAARSPGTNPPHIPVGDQSLDRRQGAAQRPRADVVAHPAGGDEETDRSPEVKEALPTNSCLDGSESLNEVRSR